MQKSRQIRLRLLEARNRRHRLLQVNTHRVSLLFHLRVIKWITLPIRDFRTLFIFPTQILPHINLIRNHLPRRLRLDLARAVMVVMLDANTTMLEQLEPIIFYFLILKVFDLLIQLFNFQHRFVQSFILLAVFLRWR